MQKRKQTAGTQNGMIACMAGLSALGGRLTGCMAWRETRTARCGSSGEGLWQRLGRSLSKVYREKGRRDAEPFANAIAVGGRTRNQGCNVVVNCKPAGAR